uniref:Uncharacterized protein n=1 Tax=Avena sativa TaxID=4498 RepID=A0ACD5Z601_AVESA
MMCYRSGGQMRVKEAMVLLFLVVLASHAFAVKGGRQLDGDHQTEALTPCIKMCIKSTCTDSIFGHKCYCCATEPGNPCYETKDDCYNNCPAAALPSAPSSFVGRN